LTEPDVVHPSLTAEANVNNSMCNGGTGSISVDVKSGTPSYSYNIDGGIFQSSNLFNNVSVGPHKISVKDAYNTITLSTVTITEPSAITFTTTVDKPSTPTASDGIITISANGGTGTYTYSIGGNFYSNNKFTVAAETYTVTVMDDNGCTSDPVNVTVDAPTVYVGMEKDGGIVVMVNVDGVTGLIVYPTDNAENTWWESNRICEQVLTPINTWRLPYESEMSYIDSYLDKTKTYWTKNVETYNMTHKIYKYSNGGWVIDSNFDNWMSYSRAVKEF
jgi:hypothetical protein